MVKVESAFKLFAIKTPIKITLLHLLASLEFAIYSCILVLSVMYVTD